MVNGQNIYVLTEKVEGMRDEEKPAKKFLTKTMLLL